MSNKTKLPKAFRSCLAITLTILGMQVPSVADAAVKSSSGKACTIIGTAGNDVLTGTNNNDVICGLGGNDRISGLGGNDIIDGGAGVDTISGGDGNDTIDGGSGNDQLHGDSGNDRLLGESGNDQIFGDAGNDGLLGGPGSDSLAGADGEPAVDEKNLCEKDANDQITYCGYDNEAPWIESISMSRTQVDTTTRSQVVKLTLHVTDGLMGVDQSSSNCSVIRESTIRLSGQGMFSRISGDAIDGIYSCAVTIDAHAASGRWGLVIETWDLVQNRSEFQQDDPQNLPEDQQNIYGGRFFGPPIMDIKQAYWITNIGKGDTYSPRITNPKLSLATLDTSSSDKSLSVTMRVTDDSSGVAGVSCGINHKHIDFLEGTYGMGTGKLISGNNLSGLWTCPMTIPKNAGQGKWTLTISAVDKSGKSYSISSSPDDPNLWDVIDLENFAQDPIRSTELNYFMQTGIGDDVAPILQNVAVTPSKVDSSKKNIEITVKFTFGPDQWREETQPIMASFLYEPTMAQVHLSCSKTKTFDNGNVIFTCKGILKRGSPSGFYQAMVLVHDALGNRGDYRGYVCTGEWFDYGTWTSLGTIGPVGIVNGSLDSSASQAFCPPKKNKG